MNLVGPIYLSFTALLPVCAWWLVLFMLKEVWKVTFWFKRVNIVVSEGIRAAIADTEKIKNKDNQPLRQEEQIKLLQKEKRRETGKQAKEQQLIALTQGERVKMKMKNI